MTYVGMAWVTDLMSTSLPPEERHFSDQAEKLLVMMSPVRSNECVSMELPGVGNSRTVRDLSTLVRAYNPKLVFLSETRQSEDQMRSLRWRLGLKGCLARSCVGRSGGIALFWEESLLVDLITISDKVIDVSV